MAYDETPTKGFVMRKAIDRMTNRELTIAVSKEIAKTAIIVVGCTIAFKAAVHLLAGDVNKND